MILNLRWIHRGFKTNSVELKSDFIIVNLPATVAENMLGME